MNAEISLIHEALCAWLALGLGKGCDTNENAKRRDDLMEAFLGGGVAREASGLCHWPDNARDEARKPR